MDPKLYYPQGGLPECERGVYGGYRDSDGGRGGGARSRRGQGSRGAAKSPAALGGAGPGARSEPAATTRAYLLSERPGPGRGAGGGAHPGGSVVPSPFHCRRPQLRRRFRGVDGVGGREREGRGEARVVVTGDGEGGARRPEGARVRECGRRTEAGATTVARGGGGGHNPGGAALRRRHLGGRQAWEELGAGAGPGARAGLTEAAGSALLRHGAGLGWGRSETPKRAASLAESFAELELAGPGPAFWFCGCPGPEPGRCPEV